MIQEAQNPPAFPLCVLQPNGNTWVHQDGMTLRDYFAALALPHILSVQAELCRLRCEGGKVEDDVLSTDSAAKSAYSVADAMLKERSRA